MTENGQELVIREAIPTDAADLLAYLKQVGQESTFLLVTSEDYEQSEKLEAMALADIYDSENNLLLLAFLGTELVGMIRIAGEADAHIQHIGEVGISVKRQFWGHQIGTMLLEDAIDWVKETHLIHRLTLTVQQRNQRAIRLYQKLGFQKEGTLKGGYFETGLGYIDLWSMALWLD